MLKSLKNVESAFQQTRLLALLFMVFSLIVIIYREYKSSAFEDKILSKLDKSYLLVGKQVYDIEMIENTNETRAIEALGHVERFHELYFNLDPDEKAIAANMQKAMYLVDESGRIQYEHQQNNNYFRELIADNISQRISLNKPVELDTTADQRVRFRLDATQYLSRSTSVVKRKLLTEGYLRNVQRTPNNRHGFLIEQWTILENNDVEAIKK